MCRIISLGAILLAVIAGCGSDETSAPPFEIDTLTVVLQDGVSPGPGYAGTADAVIKNGPAVSLSNGNFGAAAADTLGVVELGYALYERRLVIRWDLASITGCSQVLDATISLRVEPLDADTLTLFAYRVLRPSGNSWIEGIGGLAAGVSWTTVDGAEPWVEAGGDVDPTPLDTESIAGDSVVTFSLPRALVLTWIKQPLANHGVVIASAEPTAMLFTTVHMRESSLSALRPRMRIVYIKGG